MSVNEQRWRWEEWHQRNSSKPDPILQLRVPQRSLSREESHLMHWSCRSLWRSYIPAQQAPALLPSPSLVLPTRNCIQHQVCLVIIKSHHRTDLISGISAIVVVWVLRVCREVLQLADFVKKSMVGRKRAWQCLVYNHVMLALGRMGAVHIYLGSLNLKLSQGLRGSERVHYLHLSSIRYCIISWAICTVVSNSLFDILHLVQNTW